MDFYANESGDLLLAAQEISDRLKLSFSYTATKKLKVSLFLAGASPVASPTGQFRLSFSLAESGGRGGAAKTVSGNEELMQRCKLALATEFGECPGRPGFGSELALWRKKPLLDQNVILAIQAAAEEALKTIVAQVSVIAKPEKGAGNLAQRTIFLYIYSGQRLVTEFLLV